MEPVKPSTTSTLPLLITRPTPTLLLEFTGWIHSLKYMYELHYLPYLHYQGYHHPYLGGVQSVLAIGVWGALGAQPRAWGAGGT